MKMSRGSRAWAVYHFPSGSAGRARVEKREKEKGKKGNNLQGKISYGKCR